MPGQLTGRVIGTGIATGGGLQVPYRMVVPDKTPGNIRVFALEMDRWKKIVERFEAAYFRGELSPDVSRRASFADEVLSVVGDYVRTGSCCNVVAQSAFGDILGVLNYIDLGSHQWSISLMVVAPDHIPGTPGDRQLRGVGTSLVAACSRMLLEYGAESVILYPLDDAAYRFWIGRGFAENGDRHELIIRGRAAIERLIGSCQVKPDCAADPCLTCGTQKQTITARRPALAPCR